MHFHLPKPLHGWREFAGEVGIIVLGVLIALSAEQLAHDIEAHRRAAQAEARIRDELGGSMGTGLERLAVQKCLQSRISQLAEGLSSGRTDWSGLVLPASTVFPLTLREVYRSPNRNWVEDAYHEALAKGDLDSSDPNLRARLAGIYKQVEHLGQLNQREHELNTQLARLQFSRTLSDAERDQLLGTVAQLDYINASMVLSSRQNIENIHRLGEDWRDKPVEIPHDQLFWDQMVAHDRANYGSCVDRSVVTLVDTRLH